mmetsp:Transcript_6804/g.12628  ORF Transcript_6804/g.12628 Transcript_6804/m.12628 type:complete len:289 (+) Transcript_6804:152-1018(+)
MDFPLLSKDAGLTDEDTEKKKKKKRKRQDREAALLRDVLARAPPEADTDFAAPAVSTKASAVESRSIKMPNDPLAGKESDNSNGLNSSPLDPRVPLKLYVSNLAPQLRKHHLEALCLGQDEVRDASGALLPILTVSDLVEVVLVAEDRTVPGGAHRGFGFVELTNHEASARILALDGTEVMGKYITVRPAVDKKPSIGNGDKGVRRFGSQDYTALAEGVEKRHKQLVAAQVKHNEEARRLFLVEQEEKAAAEESFVAQGGMLPGGLGHGFDRGTGKPKLHSGYRDFEL